MAAKAKLKILHLYPQHLNLYGDFGNILALKQRSAWRSIDATVDFLEPANFAKDFRDYDIVFIGGGQDAQQELVAHDFMKRKAELTEAVDNGLVILAICGGYQLLGQSYETSDGQEIPGLGILDVKTKAKPQEKSARQDRLVGNVVAKLQIKLQSKTKLKTLVGFENHSGRTYIEESSKTISLAKVTRGFGNNAVDKTEGANYKNVFGTYLHGSLLPKNPHFTDELLFRALDKQGIDAKEFLSELDDRIEVKAHEFALGLR